MQPALSFIYN